MASVSYTPTPYPPLGSKGYVIPSLPIGDKGCVCPPPPPAYYEEGRASPRPPVSTHSEHTSRLWVSQERYGRDVTVFFIALTALSIIAVFGPGAYVHSPFTFIAVAGGIGILASLTAFVITRAKLLPTVILDKELGLGRRDTEGYTLKHLVAERDDFCTWELTITDWEKIKPHFHRYLDQNRDRSVWKDGSESRKKVAVIDGTLKNYQPLKNESLRFSSPNMAASFETQPALYTIRACQSSSVLGKGNSYFFKGKHFNPYDTHPTKFGGEFLLGGDHRDDRFLLERPQLALLQFLTGGTLHVTTNEGAPTPLVIDRVKHVLKLENPHRIHFKPALPRESLYALAPFDQRTLLQPGSLYREKYTSQDIRHMLETTYLAFEVAKSLTPHHEETWVHADTARDHFTYKNDPTVIAAIQILAARMANVNLVCHKANASTNDKLSSETFHEANKLVKDFTGDNTVEDWCAAIADLKSARERKAWPTSQS